MIKIREPEKFVPLRIGFIGYNSRLTEEGLVQFAENNKEDVEKFNCKQSYIRLKNETEIVGLYENSAESLKGYNLDQCILFDDNRWEIEWKRYNFIKRVIERCISSYSCVPKKYWILKYEDIR